MQEELQDVCTIRYGRDYKGLANGNVPLYGSGGIMGFVDRAISAGQSVLIPRKGTLGNLFYSEGPFWTIDTLFWTDINANKILPRYLYYLLKEEHLEELNVGTAVPSLTVEVLNRITISYPTIDEQLHRLAVLTTIEQLIATHKRTNDYLAA